MEGLTRSELLASSSNDAHNSAWVAENVLHPFVNGTGVAQIYNNFVPEKEKLAPAAVPEAPMLSTNWAVHTMASASGALLTYALVGRAVGNGLSAISYGAGLEGKAAAIMTSTATAQIIGAGLYDFAKAPNAGETRLGNAAGSMAAFGVYSIGNGMLGASKTIADSTLLTGAGRIAVGMAGGLTSLETSHGVASLQGADASSLNWDQRMSAMASGAFINVSMPVMQKGISALLDSHEPSPKQAVDDHHKSLQETPKHGDEAKTKLEKTGASQDQLPKLELEKDRAGAKDNPAAKDQAGTGKTVESTVAEKAAQLGVQSADAGTDALTVARNKLYSISGGSIDSGDVQAARISTAERTAFFRSPEFKDWVKSEKDAGREVFWLKDVDKTQAAGDVFTYFFKWRADNNKFTPDQLKVIDDFLLERRAPMMRSLINATRELVSLPNKLFDADMKVPKFAQTSPYHVLDLWEAKEAGQPGVGLLDFWSKLYWPSQVGLTQAEKLAQVNEFAPEYAKRVYPGVAEENQTLEKAGVNVVIVSNGDQELAKAAAPILGIKPENVVGSHLMYDANGKSTGVNHAYEIFEKDWAARPQPGKALSFHYWMNNNRERFGWDQLDDRKVVIAGRDGDSASSDGGMMIYLPPPAIGNFIVDTPGEPSRAQNFYNLARKYGYTKGQFITLGQKPSELTSKP